MKERTKKIFAIAFLLMTVVGLSFSVVFFGFSTSDKVKYSGMTFKADGVNKLWIAKIKNREAGFSYLPADTSSIIVEGAPFELLKGKLEIDTTYDLNGTNAGFIALAQHQMALTLGAYEVYVRNGFTAENKYKFPVIDCSSATSLIPVVYFVQSNVSKISVRDNCVIAEAAAGQDFIRVKDRIIYGILEVI